MTRSLIFRLSIGIAVILGTFALTGFFSLRGIEDSRKSIDALLDTTVPLIEKVNSMDQSVVRRLALSRVYSHFPDPSVLQHIRAEQGEFARNYALLVRDYELFQGTETEDLLAASYDQFRLAEEKLLQKSLSYATLADPEGERGRKLFEEIAALEKLTAIQQVNYSRNLDDAVRQPIKAFLGRERTAAAAQGKRNSRFFLLSTLLALALGVAVSIFIARAIQKPIDVLSKAVSHIAGGDRSTHVAGPLPGEFSLLIQSFNEMVDQLSAAEKELMDSYYQQRMILDTIPVGLMTIGRDYRTGTEYSSEVRKILEIEQLSRESVLTLLFPAEGDEDRRKELERYLRQMFENTTADMDFLEQLNPVTELLYVCRKKTFATVEKHLEIHFERIYDGLSVSGLLMTVSDTTGKIQAEKALVSEKAAHQRETESIHSILSAGPGPLNDFLHETRAMIAEIREALKDLSPDRVNACFRLLHSIKGSAGSLGIEAVASIAHEAESLFVQMRDLPEEDSAASLFRVHVLLGSIGEELDLFEGLVARLRDALKKMEGLEQRDDAHEDLTAFVGSLGPMVEQLSKTLSKTIRFASDIQVSSLPHFRDLRNVIIHLVRNCADHGLEDSYERLFKGKDQAGLISLGIKMKDARGKDVVIEVKDDGRGLDFAKIEAKAREKGLIGEGENADRNTLISCLFKPGFSTKTTATEISGRGVGLDLVRSLVASAGGRLAVSSTPDKGTCFRVIIPV